jgi:hypothetical protein
MEQEQFMLNNEKLIEESKVKYSLFLMAGEK